MVEGGAPGIGLAIKLAEQFKDVLVVEIRRHLRKVKQDLYNGTRLGHSQSELHTRSFAV